MSRGFFGIGIENGKTPVNLGTLFRSAQAFGADFIFTIGKRYSGQRGDTGKSWKSVPLFHYETFKDFYNSMPKATMLVGVEINDKSRNLTNFVHPERAVYLLGAEDWGLSQEALSRCNYVVDIPTSICLNVSTTGSIVIYDRMSK